MKNYLLVFFVLLFVSIATTGFSTEILPTSYIFDKTTDKGSYDYSDWGGVQLTDGFYGTEPWSADLGKGNAYEWVGWLNDTPVNIDFDFGSTTAIDSISVGTVQDHIDDVVVPSIEVFSWNGSAWDSVASIDNSPESNLNDNQYFTFTLTNLGIVSDQIRVSLTHATDGPWTFVDEVDFHDNSNPVPEPATMVLFGLGLLGLAGVNRRKK